MNQRVRAFVEDQQRTLARLTQQAGVAPLRSLFDQAIARITATLKHTPSASMSYVQLSSLSAQANLAIANLTRQSAGVVGDAAYKVALSGARTMLEQVHAMEAKFGAEVAVPIPLLPAAKLQGLLPGVRASVMRAHETSMSRYGASLVSDMERTMSVGLAAGESSFSMIGRIEQMADLRWHGAERIVRTELSSAYNQAHRETTEALSEEMGGELWNQWSEHVEAGVALDDRVGDDSLAMDGQVAPPGGWFTQPPRAPRGQKVSESLVGEQWKCPPNRPNDRAVLVPWMVHWGVPGWIWKNGQRMPVTAAMVYHHQGFRVPSVVKHPVAEVPQSGPPILPAPVLPSPFIIPAAITSVPGTRGVAVDDITAARQRAAVAEQQGGNRFPVTTTTPAGPIVDLPAIPDAEFHGQHGKALLQDGDAVEGHAMRIVKIAVAGALAAYYYETTFKVTHAYGDQAQTYGQNQSASKWTFRKRDGSGAVLADEGGPEVEASGTKMATTTLVVSGSDVAQSGARAPNASIQVGNGGAATNSVRIRAGSMEDLQAVLDSFGKHIGADLRAAPSKEANVLATKARLVAKFAPKEFGKAMQTAKNASAQRAVVDIQFDMASSRYPEMRTMLRDAIEKEVYPGHRVTVSPTLGNRVAQQFPAMHHDTNAPADVVASILSGPGLQSSAKRFSSGTFTHGMSTSQDFMTGGADGVFLRLDTERPQTTQGAGVRFEIDTAKVMQRTDWWSFNRDNYGRAGYEDYEGRWSVPEMKAGAQTPANEVMVPHGVPVSAIRRVITKTETTATKIRERLAAKGVTHVNGVPLDQFVQTGPKT